MTIRKLLVPTDLSPEGERAFEPVAELARALHASVLLLHVIENAGVTPTCEVRPGQLPGTAQEHARARAELEARRARFRDLEVAAEVLIAPSVPNGILEHAAQRGCDAIALATHGRGGFRRLILGSVTEAVLRRSRVPVLVFPRPE